MDLDPVSLCSEGVWDSEVRWVSLLMATFDTCRGCMGDTSDDTENDSWVSEEESEGDQLDQEVDAREEAPVAVAPAPQQPQNPPAPVNACPWIVHCPGCPALPNSPALPLPEFLQHGCCGQGYAALCKANPHFPNPDPLTPLLVAAAGPVGGLNNSSRRKQVYIAWFQASARAGWLTPHFTVNARGVKRHLYSGCILRRLRQTFPDAQYLGFRSI